MKKFYFSVFSLLRKFKIHMCLKLAVILIVSMTINISAAGLPGAQQVTVEGVITDATTGEGLPGVNVAIVGTTIGTISDISGYYALKVPNASENLQFSFIGYLTQIVAINGQTTLNVALLSDIAQLSEVVVIGYGTEKKVNVIGSIAQISSKEITSSPVSNATAALAARLPGVIVQQRTGEPGRNAASILIRGKSTFGTNGPLVIIDGVQDRDLNSIQLDDIETISVLKDASAAIYGSRSANGVILVTTKNGKFNEPLSLTYGYYQGFNSPTMLPQMTDAPTYAQMVREAQGYLGVNEENMKYSLDDIEKYKSGEYIWTHPNSDALDQAVAKFSGINHHSLAIKGGTKAMKYYGSVGRQSEDGIYQNNSTTFKRYNVKLNLDFEVNKYLNVGLYSNSSKDDRVYPTLGSELIFQYIQDFRPTEILEWPNGLPGPDVGNGFQPKIMTGLNYGSNESNGYRSYNTLSFNLKVPGIEGLSLSGSFSYDKSYSKNKKFETPFSLYSLDKVAYLAAGNTGKEDGSAFLRPTNANIPEPKLTDSFNDATRLTTNLQLNYKKTINDLHNFDAFVAYETNQVNGEGISASRRYFISTAIPYLFAGGTESQSMGSSVSLDASVNYFGRLSYNYKEIYLFQFSFRRDGSLRFSEESGRWGNFPSILIGYRPSEQDWWKNSLSFINYFKLKASYGKLGNDMISPFQYLATYEFRGGMTQMPSRIYTPGLRQSGVPNPLITWEVANMFNFGWESLFLNNKMNFDVDFFYERRNEILIRRQASVPGYAGIALADENFGIVDNKGVELSLGFSDRKGDFSYGINGNFSFVRNEIIDYDEPKRNVPWQQRTGNPLAAQALYHSIGVFKDVDQINSTPHVVGAIPGDLILADTDGDGFITGDDMILINTSRDPEITFGGSFNLGYKNWTLTGLLQGVGNCQGLIYSSHGGLLANYNQYRADGRWTPDNINAETPRATERTNAYWMQNYMSDYFSHKMDYLRMKNVMLSYQLPKNLINKINIKEAQVYFSGQNLFLFYSKNKVMDPETAFRYESGPVYPVMKTYSLGAKITF